MGSFEGEIKFAAHHRIRKFQLKGKSQVKQFFRDFNIKRCCQQSCVIIFASDSKPIGLSRTTIKRKVKFVYPGLQRCLGIFCQVPKVASHLKLNMLRQLQS